jgi:hypothetical protein
MNSAEPPAARVTRVGAGPPSTAEIGSFGPAPAPEAPDGPKNRRIGKPSSAHRVGALFVSVNTVYDVPAAAPPAAVEIPSTPVEHVGTPAIVVALAVGPDGFVVAVT